jgi:hypothetical protein
MGGLSSTCAILDNNTVKCWGRANYGQLANGTTTTRGDGANEMGDNLPVASLGTGRTVKSVIGANSHYCAILDNDTVKCWGRSNVGNLGYGDVTTRGGTAGTIGDSLLAVSLGTGLTPWKIVSNNQHTCVIFTTYAIKCWGINTSGALGVGDTATRGDGAGEMGDSLAYTNRGTGFYTYQLGLGMFHACAFSSTGKFKCWGQATNGGLGNASTTNHRGDAANEMGDNLAFTDL